MTAAADFRTNIPFDSNYLDRLMDEAGVDVLVINSKHNIQYLLGGHRSFFFDYMDAMALSRYLPVRAREGGLLRSSAGDASDRGQAVLDPGLHHQQLHHHRHDGEGGRSSA